MQRKDGIKRNDKHGHQVDKSRQVEGMYVIDHTASDDTRAAEMRNREAGSAQSDHGCSYEKAPPHSPDRDESGCRECAWFSLIHSADVRRRNYRYPLKMSH